MSYTENAIYDAGIRMDSFGDANVDVFKNTKAVGYFATMKTRVAEAGEFGSLRRSSGSAATSSTNHKSVLRRGVLADLRAIAKTANLMEDEDPNFVNEFKLLPHNLNYQVTIELAHAFADKGEPLEAEFVSLGLPAGTFADLRADTAALEAANRQKGAAGTTRVGANAQLDEVLKGILDARRGIDVVARNLFRDNPQKLAEWMTASHIERSPTRARNGGNPTT